MFPVLIICLRNICFARKRVYDITLVSALKVEQLYKQDDISYVRTSFGMIVFYGFSLLDI